MGLGGFIQHSINVIKQNRNLRSSKRAKQESLVDKSVKYGETGNPVHLERLMKYRALKRKKELRTNRIFFILFVVILVITLFFLSHKYYSPKFG